MAPSQKKKTTTPKKKTTTPVQKKISNEGDRAPDEQTPYYGHIGSRSAVTAKVVESSKRLTRGSTRGSGEFSSLYTVEIPSTDLVTIGLSGAVTATKEVEMRDVENQKESMEVERQLELDESLNEPLEGDKVLAGRQSTQKKKKTVRWKDEDEEDDYGKDSSYIYEEPIDAPDDLDNDAAVPEDENSEPSNDGLEDDMDLDEVVIDPPPCPVSPIVKAKTQRGKQATAKVATVSKSK
jgi:hypothetical protein